MNPLTCQAAVHAASDQLAAAARRRADRGIRRPVEAALAELDPLDAGLVTLIDIDGAPFSQAVLELDRYLQS